MSSESNEPQLTPNNPPPFTNEDEYVRWWLEGLIYHANNTSDRRLVLRTMGLRAVRCDCGATDCRGWRMRASADRR